MSSQARHLHPLSTASAMKLLGDASFGRMVFSHQALPAVRLVSHVVDEDSVIIRTGVAVPPLHLVLTYEADEIDSGTMLGWCVVVTGMAERVVDADEVTRYERLLPPWPDCDTDQLLRVRAQFVDGYELLAGMAA
ncbi:hypothetical protein BBK82_34500 [Lentzea guizhouensis]|uniref:Pyridoxamine 5'-phosphate oxidase n=1 Tax=Lentzea guizhouensis TaxID=1586287 RepID=A0A1B2HRM5_9PSEU|nr:pyridoxamine 5'-phosphate oxidase family protein [Lentzea guizhouensis]ANZ40377.1 hypothetical protein BBK82_34500 [Lentzea guizhouensis]